MYRDNTLLPVEAIRLAALGSLSEAPRLYAALAREVRDFAHLVTGPSLELVGPPLEVMVVEGLIESIDENGKEDDALLAVTDAGREEFRRLMTSNLRAPVTDLSKLIIALKLRFLHLLPLDDQRNQAELLVETCERELARLVHLRNEFAEATGELPRWLDLEIEQVRSRLEWYEALAERLD